MNTRTHHSTQYGFIQINLDNWTMWLGGTWYPLNNKTINSWIADLNNVDRDWFISVVFSA